jgi:hypothetical protein
MAGGGSKFEDTADVKKRATKRPANGSNGYPPRKKRANSNGMGKQVSPPRDVYEILEELRDSRAKTVRSKD